MQIKIFSRNKIEEVINDEALAKDVLSNASVISFYDPPSRRTGEVFKPVDYRDCGKPKTLLQYIDAHQFHLPEALLRYRVNHS